MSRNDADAQAQHSNEPSFSSVLDVAEGDRDSTNEPDSDPSDARNASEIPTVVSDRAGWQNGASLSFISQQMYLLKQPDAAAQPLLADLIAAAGDAQPKQTRFKVANTMDSVASISGKDDAADVGQLMPDDMKPVVRSLETHHENRRPAPVNASSVEADVQAFDVPPVPAPIAAANELRSQKNQIISQPSDAPFAAGTLSTATGQISDRPNGDHKRDGERQPGRDQQAEKTPSSSPAERTTAATTVASLDARLPTAQPTASGQIAYRIASELTGATESNGLQSTPFDKRDRTAYTPAMRVLNLELKPANLGLVSVSLSLKDAALTITIEAQKSGTAKLIENDRDTLKDEIARAGYEIGELNISTAVAGDRNASEAAKGDRGPSNGSHLHQDGGAGRNSKSSGEQQPRTHQGHERDDSSGRVSTAPAASRPPAGHYV